MISYKHKCIFIHIPRTGGTSVESVIWPSKKDRIPNNLWMGFEKKYYNKYQTGGLQHLLADQIRQEVGSGIFNNFFKFTIVRNPWDRIVSQFIYMKQRKDLREFIEMRENDCFKRYLSLIQKKKHVQWEHQSNFFLGANGEHLVDYIVRFESLNEGMKYVFEKLGIDKTMLGLKKRKIPWKNKSNRKKHYRDYYDQESYKIVEEIFIKDIELLKYRF